MVGSAPMRHERGMQPAGDRAESQPSPRDAQQLRRAVGPGPDRQVRPGVEAVAVRQADGLLAGAAANKFVFFSGALALQQPRSVQRILGERSILELVGADHRRVRGALSEFLRPEMLRSYVGKIDGEVRRHVEENWAGGRDAVVTVLPLMKRLTFDVIASLLFGLDGGCGGGARRDALAGEFERMMEGMLAVPVDLPFTAFRRSVAAGDRARRMVAEILRERAAALARGEATRGSDLIACLLSLRDDRGERLLSDEEIVDTAMVALVAGHDTSSILMTFMIRHLATDQTTLASMDLTKMKLTWRVAQETLRTVPPILGNFRKALEDVEFDGYVIPKGWQVFWVASVTHMDGSIFPDPSRFDPSRFESQSSSASAAPPCSFVAFGGGPRICPGIEFARIETLVTMHHLVRRFRWKLCGKEDTFARDPMPTPRDGLPIQIEHI
uniref:Cytochrome P450 n=1 Tax=Leersia perrieri TaxID=77586 RepID=A0A0D9WZI7_9ORYZ